MNAAKIPTLFTTKADNVRTCRPMTAGTETELMLCCLSENTAERLALLNSIIEELSKLQPAMPGPDRVGIFNQSGRFYVDHGGHLELATRECSNPFELVGVQLQQEELLRVAAARVGRSTDLEFFLANCNHNRILDVRSKTWGVHDSYLSMVPPERLVEQLLPFIATAGYLRGSGGVTSGGDYIACTRALFLSSDRGGDTTKNRAIFSTSRRENFTNNPGKYGYRVHLIDSDGQRSQLSRFLKCFTITCIIMAIEAGYRLKPLPVGRDLGKRGFWYQCLQECNKLNERSRPGSVELEPMVVLVQREYLALVDQWYSSISNPHPWIGEGLAIWETVLNRIEANDYAFLSARLDPWIKHFIMSEYLDVVGAGWEQVRIDTELTAEISLLNQQYHAIAGNDSPFELLESDGLLKHRVLPKDYSAGPPVGTRARARSDFILAHQNEKQIQIDWDRAIDFQTNRVWQMADPISNTITEVKPSH